MNHRSFLSPVLVLCLAVCCGCAKSVPPEETPAGEADAITDSISLGDASESPSVQSEEAAAVELTLADWDGVQAEVKKHAGKVVVLDLWATSCQPCVREFPKLVALSNSHPEQVVCLSCSADYIGIKSKPPEYYKEDVLKFLTEQNASFTNFLCTEASDVLFEKLDLGSIPAVLVYGPDGELAERFDNDEGKYGDEFTYAEHVIPLVEKLTAKQTAAE